MMLQGEQVVMLKDNQANIYLHLITRKQSFKSVKMAIQNAGIIFVLICWQFLSKSIYIKLAVRYSSTSPLEISRVRCCYTASGTFWWHVHCRWTKHGIKCCRIQSCYTATYVTRIDKILYIKIYIKI